MTDIVERLRAGHLSAYQSLRNEAADEIERLRNVAQPATALRDYLVQIRNVCRDNAPLSCDQRIALDYVQQPTVAALSSAK